MLQLPKFNQSPPTMLIIILSRLYSPLLLLFIVPNSAVFTAVTAAASGGGPILPHPGFVTLAAEPPNVILLAPPFPSPPLLTGESLALLSMSGSPFSLFPILPAEKTRFARPGPGPEERIKRQGYSRRGIPCLPEFPPSRQDNRLAKQKVSTRYFVTLTHWLGNVGQPFSRAST